MGDHEGLQGMFSGRELHEKKEAFRVKSFRLGTVAEQWAWGLRPPVQSLQGISGRIWTTQTSDERRPAQCLGNIFVD